MKTSSVSNFNKNDQTHLKHLRIKGLQPKTIEAYSRAIRRIGDYFDTRLSIYPNSSSSIISQICLRPIHGARSS